jgi:hypothetical protein
MLFHLLSRDGTHTLSHVTLDLGSGPQDAELLSAAPLCHSLSDGLDGYRLEIRSAAGQVIIIDAEVEQAATLGMIGKSELGIGACVDASHWLVDGQTRFTWDGEIAAGLTERTVPT